MIKVPLPGICGIKVISSFEVVTRISVPVSFLVSKSMRAAIIFIANGDAVQGMCTLPSLEMV